LRLRGTRFRPWGAYLRIVGAPPGTPTGAPPRVGALGKVGALGEGPEIVVFRQVGTAFVVPTDGQLYVPTDGAVTVPYPAVPAAWASGVARLAGSFFRFTGIEPIITRKTARQKNRRASLSVLACPTRAADVGLTKIIFEFEKPAA
jgi:hypothetical protein